MTENALVHWGHPEPVDDFTTLCMLTEQAPVTYVNDDVTCRACIDDWISEGEDDNP